ILDRARARGIPCKYLPADAHKTKLDGVQEVNYLHTLLGAGVEYVVLAGFMRMIKGGMLATFPRRIINIHPALLPAFSGLHSWEQALAHGVKVTGCTVHFVDGGMDSGPIIAQATVPVLDDDTPATLHARIQEQEHVLYPRALQLVADGRITVQGRRVVQTTQNVDCQQ
ncbi:MAG: phosphoribosylglycinamide formyltransferase, partial [bacterium]|nr:phosphoribosylglycinamide formyltransferase [bacterium]